MSSAPDPDQDSFVALLMERARVKKLNPRLDRLHGYGPGTFDAVTVSDVPLVRIDVLDPWSLYLVYQKPDGVAGSTPFDGGEVSEESVEEILELALVAIQERPRIKRYLGVGRRYLSFGQPKAALRLEVITAVCGTDSAT
ncbi:hypothetical protein [Arthrobacter sp. MDT1-65]